MEPCYEEISQEFTRMNTNKCGDYLSGKPFCLIREHLCRFVADLFPKTLSGRRDSFKPVEVSGVATGAGLVDRQLQDVGSGGQFYAPLADEFVGIGGASGGDL